eukprot:12029327-Ditylum_brightwellii.AAC.1
MTPIQQQPIGQIENQTLQNNNARRQTTLPKLLTTYGTREPNIDWDEVLTLLQNNPREAIAHDAGWSPLRRTVYLFRPPTSVVHALIAANGDALHSPDGWTPLFLACYANQSTDIIQILLDKAPEVASQRVARNNWIPLHFAHNCNTLKILLRAHPEGVSVKDNIGQLPLHLAASWRVQSPEALCMLVSEGIKRNVGGINGGG